VLTLLGELVHVPQQGKHKAPSTATHPPLTPTFPPIISLRWTVLRVCQFLRMDGELSMYIEG
jgi:hypothetical protein